MVNFDKKNHRGKMIYVQFALSVKKGHIKYTVAPKEAYRLHNFILNILVNLCVYIFKKYL